MVVAVCDGKPVAGADQTEQLIAMALPQFIRERILGVLGPGKPSRADFEVLKRRRFLFPESVHMILMLVGDDNEIEMGRPSPP